MTTEELLKPRWKVIADYPGNQREVNEIIDGLPNQWDNQELERQMNLYPHLFEELHWSEMRELEEMPRYVKIATKSFHDYGQVRAVTKWTFFDTEEFETGTIEAHWFAEGERLNHHVNHLEPATEEEYLSHQSHTEK